MDLRNRGLPSVRQEGRVDHYFFFGSAP
jgi:hypothetical protein